MLKLNDESRRETVVNAVPAVVNYTLASAVLTISAGLLTFAYIGSAEQSLVPKQWGLSFLLTGA